MFFELVSNAKVLLSCEKGRKIQQKVLSRFLFSRTEAAFRGLGDADEVLPALHSRMMTTTEPDKIDSVGLVQIAFGPLAVEGLDE